MTQHLSSLRKEQRRCLEAAANNPDGKIYAGPETPYKLTFCRALVRKGYFAGSLTTKGQQPFTITQEGRDALDPLHDYVTFSPQIETVFFTSRQSEIRKRRASEMETERLRAGILAYIQTRLYGDDEDWVECLECEKWATRPDKLEHLDTCSIKMLSDLLK